VVKKTEKKVESSAEKKSEGKLKAVSKKAPKVLKPRVPSDLEKHYYEKCVPQMVEQFGFANVMRVPRLKKIVVNASIKEGLQDIKILQLAATEIASITGQRPVITKAKKSIANFKLRKGQAIGVAVTLRGTSMYEFMSRLVNVALPRVRDFKGIPSRAFDGNGNCTVGLMEQTIFPEIDYDKVQKQYGMNITFVSTAKNDAEGRALLKYLGMPFGN